MLQAGSSILLTPTSLEEQPEIAFVTNASAADGHTAVSLEQVRLAELKKCTADLHAQCRKFLHTLSCSTSSVCWQPLLMIPVGLLQR